uniref:Uncharacterized protein n=1 Tax=Rhizophora mucronata TaxID=61149 RepID=A0A2P2KDC9_RHIMU
MRVLENRCQRFQCRTGIIIGNILFCTNLPYARPFFQLC